jgi:ComF family protein
MFGKLSRVAGGLINLVFPARCLLCYGIIAEIGFCDRCWDKLHFIAPPYCQCCGLPLFVENPSSKHLCAKCLQGTYQFSKMRSVFVYDDGSRKLIRGFKYHGFTHMAKFLGGACMAYAGSELMSGVDVVVPMPLHRLRLLKRKYNQAVLLAQSIAKIYRIPFRPRALIRVRHTKYQSRLRTDLQRTENVRDAFRARDKALLANKIILLVDDVFTTGASVGSCTRELIKANVKEVRVLTLARARVV